ncbi:MAG: DinB family protein [Terriglobales bacterium]|jgi:DinB family protein
MPNHDQSLRQHLLELLQGGHAHATFDAVIANIPANLRGKKPAGYPHSLWMLLEHLRLAQWDILEFSRNPKYSAPKWPDDYWPKSAAPPSPAAWNASVKKFRADLTTTQNLVKNPRTDLFAKIPWGDGQTILREVLLLADHNSHHLAQMIDIRRLLGDWPSR